MIMQAGVASHSYTHMMNHVQPLHGICEGWRNIIERGKQDKQEKFQKYADESAKFFNGPHNFMWGRDYSDSGEGFLAGKAVRPVGLPNFRMTVNKLFEAVAIFGPMLYHNNPDIICTPRPAVDIPPDAFGLDQFMMDPMLLQQFVQVYQQAAQMQSQREYTSSVFQAMLNWLQQETDKRSVFRPAITEMIVKGGGCLWTEAFTPAGSDTIYPRTTWDSIDNLIIDPDANRWDDVTWIARRRCRPKWELERMYQLIPGALEFGQGVYSHEAMSNRPQNQRENKKEDKDYIGYWEIWSKVGMGQRFHGMEMAAMGSPVDLESFGDFCYLVIADGIGYPLNLPPEAMVNQDDALMRVSWPVPFWKDVASGGWPMTMVRTYEDPDSLWPISMGKMIMGELRFVNWAFSYMADRIAASSKTLMAVSKEFSEELRNSIAQGDGPFTLIELSQLSGKSIGEVLEFMDAPQMGTDIWTMISAVLEQIDKRTGLNELMYGMSSNQFRSAAEANVKAGNMAVRPDDMAECVEYSASVVARKEAIAMHWLMRRQDVAPIIGPVAALYYEQMIATLHPDQFIRDYDVKIEAGTARKPNRMNKIQELNEFGQVAMPAFQMATQWGQIAPLNNYIGAMADLLQVPRSQFMIQPPMMPGMMMPGQPPAPPGAMAL